MKSVAIANGIYAENTRSKPLLFDNNEALNGFKITVQQAFCKWYHLLNGKANLHHVNGSIFTGVSENLLMESLQTDIDLAPSLLMEEFISHPAICNKEQYIRLVQALLVNISNLLFEKQGDYNGICNSIQSTLNFMQNFFYQYFDLDSHLPKFSAVQFNEPISRRIENLQVQHNHSRLFTVLMECIADKIISTENSITYRQTNYLHQLMQQMENLPKANSEDYLQEIFIYNNFNVAFFTEHEIDKIKNKIAELQSHAEVILFLQAEQFRVSQLKVKSGLYFEPHQSPVKRQLTDWLMEEIKRQEVKTQKASNNELLIDPESKIQTSLSVAKLAVLVRLMVVDKVIINRTVAPMLKTVSKLFTTLQKDDISFGSLETKYHAPDKATLTVMKDMLTKWGALTEKL